MNNQKAAKTIFIDESCASLDRIGLTSSIKKPYCSTGLINTEIVDTGRPGSGAGRFKLKFKTPVPISMRNKRSEDELE